MPDTGNVGVLELTIEDNSRSAGKGLKELTGALTAVKAAVEGFSLDPVGQQVVQLAKTIQEAKGTSTIIKNLGTMFNAVNKFANLKNFNIDTDKIRDMAQNMLKLADAKERVDAVSQSGAGVSDWRSSMGGIADKTKETVDSVTEQTNKLEGTMTHFQQMLGRSTHIQIFGGKGNKQVTGQIEMDLDSLMKKTTEATEHITSEYREMARNINGTTVDFSKFDPDKLPIGSLGMKLSDATDETVRYSDIAKDAFKTIADTGILDSVKGINEMQTGETGLVVYADNLENTWEKIAANIGTVAPNIEQVSETEKNIELNAKHAQAAIEYLISTLNKKVSYKGFSEVVNALTGVAREGNGSMINEATTMFKPLEHAADQFQKVSEITEGVIRIFDAASGCYKDISVNATQAAESNNKVAESMERVKTAEQDAISLMDIPASGKNGVFANANEEMQYLIQQIEQAKLSQQQFNDIAANAEKQLKYGGPVSKDELTFNLQHATEGYYQAAEAEEVYQESLRNLMIYVQQAAAGIRDAAQVTETMPLTQSVEELGETAAETASGGMEAFKREIEEITESAAPAVSKIELLQNKIRFIQEKIRDRGMELLSLGLDPTNDSVINDYYLQVGRINEQIDKLVNKAHEAQEAMRFDQMKQEASGSIVPWTAQDVDNLVNQYSEMDLLTMKMEGMKQALMDDINQNKLDTQQIADRTMAIQNLKDKIDELTKAQESASSSTFSLSGAWSTLKKGIASMFPTITGLIKQFTRMAKMRAIRYVIRQIAAGFKEGIQNVYEYSKAIEGTFAPSMDSAASSLAQMKNSLGAALAPVLQSLIPVLQTVINWFITAINYVNQFFALLLGQSTWTRALPQTTEAFKKQEKAAKATGAAVKDLLADWDELNIIQSNTSGSGGVSGTSDAENYLEMFEEVNTFDDKIRNVVNFIKDNFETIKTLAEAIGLAILTWRLSSAFGKDLSLLQKLTLAAGLTLAITGIKITADAGYSIGKNGINGENAMEAVKGVLLTMVGGGLAGFAISKTLTGGLIGLVIGAGVALTVLGLEIRKGEIDSLYGDVSKDVEEIRKDVEDKVLSIEAKATIDVVKANLKSTTDAEKKVSEAIDTLNKDYPVGVTITPENASDFKKKVDALVIATNGLINSSENTLRLSVPASPTFDSADDFHLFTQEAWGGVQTYVTGIGEDIGKMLSDGITSGTQLDELKQKLIEMSTAVLTAQNQAQFAGQVGILGAGLRENDFKNFDKDTIQKYVDEYNKLSSETMGQAEAQATAELVERQRLVAALEEMRDQGAKEFKQADLDKAREELEAYWDDGKGVAKRAKELFDEWTLTGRTLFGTDMAKLFSGVMEKSNGKISFSEWWTKNVKDAVNWFNGSDADQYIKTIKDNLYGKLAWDTGMNKDSISKMFSLAGINPMDIIPENTGKEIRTLIIENLSNSNYTKEEKEKIAKAFGIELDSFGNVAMNREEYLKLWGDITERQTETYQEVTENIESAGEKTGTVYDNLLDKADELVRKADETVEKSRKVYSSSIGNQIEGMIYSEGNGLDSEQRLKYWKRIVELEQAGNFETLKLIQNYLEEYGVAEGFEMFDRYGEGHGKVRNPARVTGGMGISDVGWTPRNYVTPSQTGESVTVRTEAVSNQQDADNVADGTQRGTSSLLDALNSILEVARAINRKEFTVSLFPSSLLGGTNRKSDEMYGAVTGDD